MKLRIRLWRPHRPGPPPPPLPRPGLPDPLPPVSILIPTTGRLIHTFRGPLDIAALCVRSIREKTTYPNYEILVSHNGPHPCSVPHIRYEEPGPFNLARKINSMIRRARGEYLILLNDDTEVIAPDWIQALLEFAVLPDTGAVGALLHYPDGRIQHGGVTFGSWFQPWHSLLRHPYDCPAAAHPREFIAVTGACMMIRRGEFLDENFPHFWDVDFCLRARARGLRIVYTPFARLFHLESVSVRHGGPAYNRELLRLFRRWPELLRDPFPPQKCNAGHD